MSWKRRLMVSNGPSERCGNHPLGGSHPGASHIPKLRLAPDKRRRRPTMRVTGSRATKVPEPSVRPIVGARMSAFGGKADLKFGLRHVCL